MPVLPENEEEWTANYFSNTSEEELEQTYFDDDLIQLLHITREEYEEGNRRVIQ